MNEDLLKVRECMNLYSSLNTLRNNCARIQQEYNVAVSQKIDINKIKNDIEVNKDDYRVSKFWMWVLFVAFSMTIPLMCKVLGVIPLIDTQLGMVLFIILIFAFSILIPYVILKFRVLVKRSKAQNEYNSKVARATEKNKKIDEQCAEISNRLAQERNKCNDFANQLRANPEIIIPEHYWGVAGDIYNLMMNKRADTVKEAINLLEDIWHKNRLEDLTAQNAPIYIPNDNSAELDLLRKQVDATKQNTRAVENLDSWLRIKSME